jgi:hypothetical protein
MKIITIAVPDEEVLFLEALLQQTNITILEEKEDYAEVFLYELELEESEASPEEAIIVMAQLERELEEEIWKLHHFAE